MRLFPTRPVAAGSGVPGGRPPRPRTQPLFGSKLFGQELVYPGLVETNNHLVVDNDYRDTHLPRLLNHLLGRIPIPGHINIGVGNPLLRKILLRPLAPWSGIGRIDNHLPLWLLFRSCGTHLSPPIRSIHIITQQPIDDLPWVCGKIPSPPHAIRHQCDIL